MDRPDLVGIGDGHGCASLLEETLAPHLDSGAELIVLAKNTPGYATALWQWNGGDPAVLPVTREFSDWLASLPCTALRGRHMFVHAGVRPGVALAE